MPPRPGGPLATRPLHFIWIADCSGSMAQDGKIQALNNAIREALPHMRRVAEDNPNGSVLVRALRFSTLATWHVATPTPVAQFQWDDLEADGETKLGLALEMLTEQLKMPPMEQRAFPPVLVLISDGHASDDYKRGMQAMLREPWGSKAVRVAIGIGQDVDQDMLQEFIGNKELRPLQADNPESLVALIQWVSTAVLQSVSSPINEDVTRPSNLHIPVMQPRGGASPGSLDTW